MSATVATLVIDPCNRTAIWAHLGDTRIYLFRRNRIECVTKDHSLVQQFIDAGYCKADQLRTHPQRSKLFAAIGAETDTALCLPQKPIELEDGDSFLICTDGFWEWIDEDEMETALSMATSANAWLADMARTVGKRGCIPATQPDNYTAFAIWVGEPNEVTIRQ
jgi:serine/threonine protein phosphatase PrpC